MSNLIDYIKWRGDLELQVDEFNEVDGAILARFSYFPFDTLIEKDQVVSIRDLSIRFMGKDINKLQILWPDDVDLFPTMGMSNRFGELMAGHFVKVFDQAEEKQFAAISVFLPDNSVYISFRGTDNSIVGWKEDFNMSFKSHMSSQISAKEYVQKISEIYPDKKIRVGGHSKGGNLAVYSAIFSSEDIKERILKVYNFDGPGFCEDIIECEEYNKIIDKVYTYIPKSSIIGRLMNHKEENIVVESVEKGIMQHDIYSWQVICTKFIEAESLTNSSNFIDKTITAWLADVEPKKRELVIDAIFDILYQTNEQTFKEIKSNIFENTKIMVKSYQKLDPETKKLVTNTVSELLKTMLNVRK